MRTVKAGCYLVNLQTKKLALVFREYYNDYSFPKGHLEEGEDIKTCAIRETAEETKREAKIVEKFKPYVEKYTTPKGEDCVCYMFIAIDVGKSDNTSEDTHPVVWIDIDKVEEILTYKSLKKGFRSVKKKIESLMNEE